jgi:hypothetical protein
MTDHKCHGFETLEEEVETLRSMVQEIILILEKHHSRSPSDPVKKLATEISQAMASYVYFENLT